MFSCSLCCGGRCCEMQCCEMLLLDDGCREEYLCIERIICEGCKIVTWLNELFNIYTYQFVRWLLRMYLWYLRKFGESRQSPTQKNVSGTNLCRLVGGLLSKCADFWLSGRHVADMSVTFPAKPRITPADTMVVNFGRRCGRFQKILPVPKRFSTWILVFYVLRLLWNNWHSPLFERKMTLAVMALYRRYDT